MKKLILLTIAIIVIIYSCAPNRMQVSLKENLRKYQNGEFVYVKPDSERVVINGLHWCCCPDDNDSTISYNIIYSNHKEYVIKEYMIYGK